MPSRKQTQYHQTEKIKCGFATNKTDIFLVSTSKQVYKKSKIENFVS